MLRLSMFVIAALLLVLVPNLPPDAFAQNVMDANIVALDLVKFPEIHLFVQVSDSTGGPILGLTEDNFSVVENGAAAIFDVAVAYIAGTSYGMALDCSGSMSGYENDVVFACTTFVAGMHPLEQAAVIFFESYNNTHVVQPMTNNKELLTDAVLQYYAYGMTAQWYGYYLALEECRYELPPRVMIGFTDGNDNQSGTYTQESVTLFAQLIGAPVYTIGLGNLNPDPLIEVAEATGGEYIHTDPDSLWWYYQQIQHAYQNQYEVAYISPNPIPDGSPRLADVGVSYGGNSTSDSIRFAAPFTYDFAPVITLTPYTQDTLLGEAQPANASLTVSAWITDNDVVTAVLIRHRHIGDVFFNYGVMNLVSNSLYEFTFTNSYVQDPGIEFYILASDSYYHTVSSPPSNPGLYPHQIAVLPNEAPEIDHTPVLSWPAGAALPVSCEILDVTNYINNATLYYKNTDEIFWTESLMNNSGGNTWEAVVPAGALQDSLNLEYMIRAWDDRGAYSTEGPHFVDVGVSPLQITLTPENPPIQIPAGGGSFNFNVALSNTESSAQTFDVWFLVTLPNGSQFGPVLGPVNLTLPGNTSIDRDRTQGVPAGAPPGSYTYDGYAGVYPLSIWASDSFPFEKLTTGTGAELNEWSNSGADFTPWFSVVKADHIPPLALRGNYPNPCNARTTITYTLPTADLVKLAVYAISGKRVALLVNGWREAGTHEITFDVAELPSGVYLYRLSAGDFTATKKMILLK